MIKKGADYSRLVLLAAFLACYLLPATTSGQVTGKIKKKEQEILLLLTVSSPTPKTMILTIHLPKGVKLLKAEPSYSKFSQEKEEAQWLLTDLKPGKLTISLSLDPPLDPGQIKAVIRYKDASTGVMKRAELK